jgi:hypothetical protein
MKVAIVFLSKTPNKGTLDFASIVAHKTTYDVHVISDDLIDTELNEFKRSKVKVIHITDEECLHSGYINSNIGDNVTHIKKNPIAYDKALYEFAFLNPYYDFVWFLEEDVFVLNASVFTTLTEKYSIHDLVVANNFEKTDNVMDWHWKHIFNKIEPPYYHSMVCACGMSRAMLDTIHDYVSEKNTLFYIESMFNTLAMQRNLTVAEAFELKTIVWLGDWGLDEFVLLPENLFHPIKEPNNHHLLRDAVNGMIHRGYKPKNNLPEFIKLLM